MREDTSGFWVTENNGCIDIGYEDYGVSEFGGGDFERTYHLDRENAQKFVQALRKKHRGGLHKMIEAAFGKNFKDYVFWSFCKENDIQYSTTTWSG